MPNPSETGRRLPQSSRENSPVGPSTEDLESLMDRLRQERLGAMRRTRQERETRLEERLGAMRQTRQERETMGQNQDRNLNQQELPHKPEQNMLEKLRKDLNTSWKNAELEKWNKEEIKQFNQLQNIISNGKV